MNETGVLVFMNADAKPKNVAIKCNAESVDHIMSWYAVYYHGDRYTVAFDGRNVPMDLNGGCAKNLEELRKLAS